MSTLFTILKISAILVLIFFVFSFLGNKAGLNSGFFAIFENIRGAMISIFDIFRNGMPNSKAFFE